MYTNSYSKMQHVIETKSDSNVLETNSEKYTVYLNTFNLCLSHLFYFPKVPKNVLELWIIDSNLFEIRNSLELLSFKF